MKYLLCTLVIVFGCSVTAICQDQFKWPKKLKDSVWHEKQTDTIFGDIDVFVPVICGVMGSSHRAALAAIGRHECVLNNALREKGGGFVFYAWAFLRPASSPGKIGIPGNQ